MEEETMPETQVSERKGPTKPFPILIIGAIIFIALLGIVVMKATKGNFAGNGKMESEAGESKTESSENTAVMQDDSDARVISIEAGSFYYTPNEIKVKKGEKVKIVMTSKDMMHNFVIDELNVHLPITKSGTTSSVVFTADKVGTFEYYCSVGQHRAHGQVGKITVEE